MDLGLAIAIYLGHGSPDIVFPQRSPERLSEACGGNASPLLLKQVEEALHFLYEYDPDWSKQTLLTASTRAVERTLARYPQISDVGAKAMIWAYSWDFK